MRQECDTPMCTNAAVAYVSTGVRGDLAFVCELHAPADVEIRR